MINLDDLAQYQRIDPNNIIAHIDNLAVQFEAAWKHGQSQNTGNFGNVTNIVICGMGTAAVAAGLFVGLVGMDIEVAVHQVEGYTLPAYAKGAQTLVLCISFNGTTEESIYLAEQAIERGCQLAAITKGGDLALLVEEAGGLVWLFDYDAPPRFALGWLYGLTLSFFSMHGVLPNLTEQVDEAVHLLREKQKALGITNEVTANRAKQIAGQIVNRVPVVWASDMLSPVARRWKSQFNLTAKSAAYFEQIPDVSHHAISGLEIPDSVGARLFIMQLVSSAEHPRLKLHHRLANNLAMQEGILTEVLETRGSSRLAQQMSLIQLGDYVSYYLAIANEIDPTPTDIISSLKNMLKSM